MSLNPDEPEEKEPNCLKEFYSHTSRVWNSAATLTMAGIALSIAAMLTQTFRDMILDYRVGIAIVFYFGILYGFLRMVELGSQLQYLESQIKINNETLLNYVNHKVPRIGFKRLTNDEAKNLEGKRICFSDFSPHTRLTLSCEV